MSKQFLFFLLLLYPTLFFAQQQGSIIPQPVMIKQMPGAFVIDANTSISFNPQQKELKAAANFLLAHLKNISGIALPIDRKSVV